MRLLNETPLCQVKPEGMLVDALVVMAYWAVNPDEGVRVTALTLIPVWVGVPLTPGLETVAPLPIATAPAETVPLTATAAVAPVTLA